MRSRRLTDIGKINGKLLDQGIAQGNFLALLPVGQDHFIQGVLEHGPAVFQIPAFGDHFGPFDQLARVARGDFGVPGGANDKYNLLLLLPISQKGWGKKTKRWGRGGCPRRLGGKNAEVSRSAPGGVPQGSGGAAGLTRWISAGFRTGSAEMRDRGIIGGG